MALAHAPVSFCLFFSSPLPYTNQIQKLDTMLGLLKELVNLQQRTCHALEKLAVCFLHFLL